MKSSLIEMKPEHYVDMLLAIDIIENEMLITDFDSKSYLDWLEDESNYEKFQSIRTLKGAFNQLKKAVKNGISEDVLDSLKVYLINWNRGATWDYLKEKRKDD